jgi:hypothetical protein
LNGKAQADMRSIIIRIIALLITIAAWLCVGVSLRGGLGPRVDVAVHQASGRIMAEQALACLEPGGQITVITRDTATFKNPASDIQLAAFLKRIDHAHAAVTSIQKIQVDPLRPIAVPSSDFYEAIQRASPGGVIVSFMGPPQMTDADRARIGSPVPAIVAFCSGNLPQSVNLRSLFQQGLLQVAVVDARNLDQAATVTTDVLNRSSQLFRALTAANFPVASVLQGGERK